MNRLRKRNIVFRCLLFLALVITVFLAGVVWYVNALLPTPSYEVRTYLELTNELKDHPNIVIADEDLLPTELYYLSVYVPNRLKSGPQAGYTILAITEDNLELSIDCRELDSYSRMGQDTPTIDPNETYSGVPVQIRESAASLSITFQTETCLYDLTLSKDSQGLFTPEQKDMAIKLVQNLIYKTAHSH